MKISLWHGLSEFSLTTAGDGVFRIAKQMDHRNQDIIGENCVHNDAGELALTDEEKMMAAWVEHYARPLSVKSVWPSNEPPGVPPTSALLPVCPRPRSTKHSAK